MPQADGNAAQIYFTSPCGCLLYTSEAEDTFVYTAEVANSTLVSLPITGGIGTLIFTFSGIALMGADVYKRQEEKQMSKQRSSGPHRRILVRLCALALIAAMLLTSEMCIRDRLLHASGSSS